MTSFPSSLVTYFFSTKPKSWIERYALNESERGLLILVRVWNRKKKKLKVNLATYAKRISISLSETRISESRERKNQSCKLQCARFQMTQWNGQRVTEWRQQDTEEAKEEVEEETKKGKIAPVTGQVCNFYQEKEEVEARERAELARDVKEERRKNLLLHRWWSSWDWFRVTRDEQTHSQTNRHNETCIVLV